MGLLSLGSLTSAARPTRGHRRDLQSPPTTQVPRGPDTEKHSESGTGWAEDTSPNPNAQCQGHVLYACKRSLVFSKAKKIFWKVLPREEAKIPAHCFGTVVLDDHRQEDLESQQ